ATWSASNASANSARRKSADSPGELPGEICPCSDAAAETFGFSSLGLSSLGLSFESIPISHFLRSSSHTARLRRRRAHSILVHVADDLHFGHRDQPFVHHFIQSRKQFLDVLLGVDH